MCLIRKRKTKEIQEKKGKQKKKQITKEEEKKLSTGTWNVGEWECGVGIRTEQNNGKKAIAAIPLCTPYFRLRAIWLTKAWWQAIHVLQHAVKMICFTDCKNRLRKKKNHIASIIYQQDTYLPQQVWEGREGASLSVLHNMHLGIRNGKRWKSSNCWMTFCNEYKIFCIIDAAFTPASQE